MSATSIDLYYLTIPNIIEGSVLPIIVGGVVVGAGIGIIGWIGLAIWSKILSIEAGRNGKPIPKEQR